MPFRKLGPSNPPSALARDETGPIMINAIKTQRAELLELATPLEKLIFQVASDYDLAANLLECQSQLKLLNISSGLQ
jgi:hypothetical protein